MQVITVVWRKRAGNYVRFFFFSFFFFFRFFLDEHITSRMVAIKFAWFRVLEAYTFFNSVRSLSIMFQQVLRY